MPKPDKSHDKPEVVTGSQVGTIKLLYRQIHKLLDLEELMTLALKESNDMDQVATDLIAAFDAATDRIAARFQKLIDAAAAKGDITPEVAAALGVELTKLNVLGQDPNNPIPTGV